MESINSPLDKLRNAISSLEYWDKHGTVVPVLQIKDAIKAFNEFDTPKPDGMQGEKNEFGKALKELHDSGEFKDEDFQPSNLRSAEEIWTPMECLMKVYQAEDEEDLQMAITLNPQLVYIMAAIENYAAQFKAPDITEGEIREFCKLIAIGVAYDVRKNGYGACSVASHYAQIWMDEKYDKIRGNWLQSHQTTPPTDSKEDPNIINHGKYDYMEHIQFLKSELQTLRDNNSKLVDLINKARRKIVSTTTDNWRDNEEEAMLYLKVATEALQSITQQDNKQKEV